MLSLSLLLAALSQFSFWLCPANLCQKFCVPHKIVRFATFSFFFYFYSLYPLLLFLHSFIHSQRLSLSLSLSAIKVTFWLGLVALHYVTLRYVSPFTSSVNAFRCSFRLTASVFSQFSPSLTHSHSLSVSVPACVVLHFAVAFLIKTFKSSSASSKRPSALALRQIARITTTTRTLESKRIFGILGTLSRLIEHSLVLVLFYLLSLSLATC